MKKCIVDEEPWWLPLSWRKYDERLGQHASILHREYQKFRTACAVLSQTATGPIPMTNDYAPYDYEPTPFGVLDCRTE